MPTRFYFRFAVIVAAVVLCAAAILAWRADQRDRAQLAAELAATRQLLAAAGARQHDRDAQLTQTLAALAAEKRTVVTPAKIVRDLPRELPLPAPITLESAPAAPATPGQTPAARTQAVIPAEDLKPLYDFALDCKACQAKLADAQGNLADEQKKTAPSPRSATRPCASPAAAALGAASDAPPNGLSSAPPPAPLPRRPLIKASWFWATAVTPLS